MSERKAFEESNNVKPDEYFWFDEGKQEYATGCDWMAAQVDDINEHWDTFRAAWQASANREGYKLVPIQNICVHHHWVESAVNDDVMQCVICGVFE